jgi:tetratricopeptide (TPR) repeat protein
MSAKFIHGLVKAEAWPRAFPEVAAALNEDPENPELLYLAGCVMRGLGNIGMALPYLAKALSKDQKQPNLWMHYGATLHDLNEWDDAIKAFEVVHQMLPTDPMPPANIAASYTQKGKWTDAINWADKALKFDPDCYIAHISRHFACLAKGRWEDGWRSADYLYGHHLAVRVYNSPENEEPTWNGKPHQTVVVQADQGLGDILMYGQCLPDMIRDCKEVILECAPRLVNLMKRNFPGLTVYGTLKQQGQDWSLNHQIDAHVHISHLPKWYRNADAEFPRKAYITPEQGRVEKWLAWLEKQPKPWIGVSWKGGIQQTQNHLRSIELDDLAPVLSKPGSFIDLSYRDNGLEIARWNIQGKSQVIVPPVDADDFEDTLALLAALDEVVTVTTTVVHACGAMGRTAKVLVPEVPQWRYALRMDDGGMIWYPKGSIQMYRRVPGETWESTIKRAAKDL